MHARLTHKFVPVLGLVLVTTVVACGDIQSTDASVAATLHPGSSTAHSIPNTTTLEPISPRRTQPLTKIRLDVAFPSLPTYKRMVHLTYPNDQSNLLFLALQQGIILVFDNDQNASTFLDIRKIVNDRGNEEGLLGLAFDPQYNINGYFYVYYSAIAPRRSVISRYSVIKQNRNRADHGSGQVILEVNQPYDNHNGGHMLFGNDGYLYIGLGDGGNAGDPHGNGQKLSVLLGSILRIDVRSLDSSGSYSIPADNPYYGNGSQRKEEIWAHGFRNPWRFSVDRLTGTVWAGDVGQHLYEEINIVRPGLNYGWNRMEGNNCFQKSLPRIHSKECLPNDLELPIVQYGQPDGCSVIGGYVYRGSKHPSLYGTYIYGDYCTGKIWGLRHDGEQVTGHMHISTAPNKIYAFGEDKMGEIYVLSSDGRIYIISPFDHNNLNSDLVR